MSNQYKHELFALPNYKSEIEKALNDKSKDGWEVISVFYHSTPSKIIPLAEALDITGLFAILRKPII